MTLSRHELKLLPLWWDSNLSEKRSVFRQSSRCYPVAEGAFGFSALSLLVVVEQHWKNLAAPCPLWSAVRFDSMVNDPIVNPCRIHGKGNKEKQRGNFSHRAPAPMRWLSSLPNSSGAARTQSGLTFEDAALAYSVSKTSVAGLLAVLGKETAGYERPFGNSRDVRDIRTGASLPMLFALQGKSARPAAERLALLRWVIFQVLIGNTDAHAKNLSFFSGPGGLSLAPAYDLVAGLFYANDQVEDSYAMAIGDAFRPADLSAYCNFDCDSQCRQPAAKKTFLMRFLKKSRKAICGSLGLAFELRAPHASRSRAREV